MAPAGLGRMAASSLSSPRLTSPYWREPISDNGSAGGKGGIQAARRRVEVGMSHQWLTGDPGSNGDHGAPGSVTLIPLF